MQTTSPQSLNVPASPAWDVYASPLGPLTLLAADRLAGVLFPRRDPKPNDSARRPPRLAEAKRQLAQYFRGERQAFELELELGGSDFERRVWGELALIPYGATVSYGEIARRIGQPEEAREVGGAVGRTPTPIVLPCHRVVGSDGSLTGYGGGLWRKRILLELERRVLAGLDPEPAWAYRQLQIV
jgi:methylated-DNA-[protein]-cysteine S-methyltransferase